jgi:hypothetical protein
MQVASVILWLTGAYPLWQAWLANRRTSLVHATGWAVAAWGAWCAAALFGWTGAWCYVALCLTGCAGVAVLGARRPGVSAWNFVVLALLAVDLLPLADGLRRGHGLEVDAFHKTWVAATIAVGVVNYLPTRLGPAACLLGLGCAWELATLGASTESQALPAGSLAACGMLALAPWVGYGIVRSRATGLSELDNTWQTFRDRFGLLWGLRLREQFNRAAAHAGWTVVLGWHAFRQTGALTPERTDGTAALTTLRALMKRFGSEEDRLSAAPAERQPAAVGQEQ